MTLEEAIKTAKFKDIYHRGVVNILYVASLIRRHQAQLLKAYDLTVPQFNVLRILRGSHPTPCTVRMIAERMIEESSNASRVVDKLKEKGLVTRFTSELDRRLVDINVTEKGLILLGKIDLVFGSLHCHVEQILTEHEAHKLNELLDRFAAASETMQDDAPPR
ncbi:MAG: MarR family transcriptional regulator [Bacteroidetes bacterium]|jgi:DNA-binding MarR family transcriptional regulator|nr:MarR family transcriptional regulator [Bacteroidota bacterium]